MSDDIDPRLERLLGEAMDARARGSVGDHAAPPAPRFAQPAADVTDAFATPVRRRARVWAPLAAAAVVAAVAGVLVVAGRDDRPGPVAAPAPTAATTPSTAAPTGSATKAVGLTTLNSDGATYGVGMPVVVYFSRAITDGRAFENATTVTADGKPLQADWYFQRSKAGNGPVEAQLRPKDYWPAHSKVRVAFAKSGTVLGDGLTLQTGLTSLDFSIGAKRVVTVDNSSHRLTYVQDGKTMAQYPVSLGSSTTPTTRGIKVVMEKGRDITMRGPGYYDAHVKDTQRLTFGGEYLHAAPWNKTNIRKGINSSNGCTNLLPGDAKALYDDLRVGDIVEFPNADGPKMTVGQGYGLWNVSWASWQSGGLVPTR